MEVPQKHGISDGSHQFYDLSELESLPCPPYQDVENVLCSGGGHGIGLPSSLPIQAFDQSVNFRTSSGTDSMHVHDSHSTVSFSPNGSPESQPDSHSYPTDVQENFDNNCCSQVCKSRLAGDAGYIRHKIRELETAMLGPDSEILDIYNTLTLSGTEQISAEATDFNQMVEIVCRRDLKEILPACAKAVENNDIITAEWLISELRQMVSVTGEPIQRLGAYMLEGLIARLASSGSSICKSLRCKEPASSELLSYMHKLYEVCPYFKFGYMSANGAIAEAMKDENKVHIIDFQIAQGTQWITLIQALAARPGGPPQIRITGIDDSTSAYARGGGLHLVGHRLLKLAESVKVPFEFHAVGTSASEVSLEDLEVRCDEVIAVNFSLTLHHVPDESVSTQNHRDRLLRLAKSLSPKVVTLVEQECNSNTPALSIRFRETLKHYLAIFESIDVTSPRNQKERINVEQHCLAREIVNIVACEGIERVERHELIGKWRSRFFMAGFTPYPLSKYVNATIRNLLEAYSDKYTLEERDGTLFLGWMNRPLVVSCAWSCCSHIGL